MAVVSEAVARYAEGELLACARSLTPTLPRTDERNLLLLFTCLQDLGLRSLVQRLAPAVIERAEAGLAQDPELIRCFRVVLGLEAPMLDPSRYQEDEGAARVAFWAACTLSREGQVDAAKPLLLHALEHGQHPSLEGMLSYFFTKDPRPETTGASGVDLELLALDVLMRLERFDLVGEMPERLVEGDDPAAAFSGLVARATLLTAEGEPAEATDRLTGRPSLIFAGTPEHLRQAAWILLVHGDSGSPSVIEALDEILARMATDAEGAAATFASLATGLAEIDGKSAHWPRLIEFACEVDALQATDGNVFLVAASAILAHGRGELAKRVDDACALRTDLTPSLVVAAALYAFETEGREGEQARNRLVRAASGIKRNPAVAREQIVEVVRLVRALLENEGSRAAADLAWSVLEVAEFTADDDHGIALAAFGAASFAAAGESGRGRILLHECRAALSVELDDESSAYDRLLRVDLELMRSQGDLVKTAPILYELRYRAERASAGPAVAAVALAGLGQLYEVMGCYGVAQRYLRELQMRSDLEATEGRGQAEMGLARIAARMSGEVPPIEVAEATAGEGATEIRAVPSPLDPMVPLLEEHFTAQKEADGENAMKVSERALAEIEAGPLRGGHLHTAVEENLALELVANDASEQGLHHWLATTRRALGHIATLAAHAPVEDLREVCEAWAHRGEIGLVIGEESDSERRQACFRELMSLRSLWADLRVLRRAAGGDTGSSQRAEIAAVRRKIARFLFDGPRHEEEGFREFIAALNQSRLDRDLDEIAGLHGKATGEELAERLRAQFDASISSLDRGVAFVGYLVVDGYEFRARSGTPWKPLSRKGEEEYIALVMCAGSFTVIPLGMREEMDPLVEALPGQLKASRGDHDSGCRPEASLQEVLVKPVQDALGESKLIHVFGEGALSEVPWGLLLGEGGEGQRRSVRVVHSFAGIARERAEQVRMVPEALVVGDPDYGEPDPSVDYEGIRSFRRLETTGVEAELVASACGSVTFEGSAAVPAAVLAAKPVGVLHVASHGFAMRPGPEMEGYEVMIDQLGIEMFIPREDFIPGPLSAHRLHDPLLHSGIALAGVNDWLSKQGRNMQDSGFITAEDLSWCDLAEVDCVVLSACSSGVGRGTRSLGSRGMRFAALAAGADWMIASLWPIPDVPTAILMEWLYEEFCAGAAPPTALDRAQRRMQKADRSMILATATAAAIEKQPSSSMARRYLDSVAASSAAAPFASAYYWCGFLCSG